MGGYLQVRLVKIQLLIANPPNKILGFVLKKYTAFIHNCILKGPTKLIKESDILLNIHFRIKKGNKISKTKNEKVNGMNKHLCRKTS